MPNVAFLLHALAFATLYKSSSGRLGKGACTPCSSSILTSNVCAECFQPPVAITKYGRYKCAKMVLSDKHTVNNETSVQKGIEKAPVERQ